MYISISEEYNVLQAVLDWCTYHFGDGTWYCQDEDDFLNDWAFDYDYFNATFYFKKESDYLWFCLKWK